MPVKTKRQQGGQPGNQNARKHGYYSRIFNKAERADYYSAGDVQGIDEEIALIRHVIKTVAQFKDDKHLLVLVRSASVLNKLIRTRQKIQSAQYAGLKDAVGNVVKDVLVPLGIDIKNPIRIKRFSDETETNNGQNEAVLP
jgi:hypothetical protein